MLCLIAFVFSYYQNIPDEDANTITVNDVSKASYLMNITGLKHGYTYTFVVSLIRICSQNYIAIAPAFVGSILTSLSHKFEANVYNGGDSSVT